MSMTPRTIQPTEVRKGDRIETLVILNDKETVHRGEVGKIDGDGTIFTPSGKALWREVWKYEAPGQAVTITLLDRPRKPLPTEPLSVIYARLAGRENEALTLLVRSEARDGAVWSSVVTVETHYTSKPWWSDAEIIEWIPAEVKAS